MSEVEDLASALDSANAVIVDAVRERGHRLAWLRPVSPADHRSAGALAHHIAIGYEDGRSWAESIKETRRMPEITEASLHARNAEHAVEFAAPTPEAVVELLEADCGLLTEYVRSLVDLELGLRSTNEVLGRQWSVRDVIDATLRHTARHTEQFLAATDG